MLYNQFRDDFKRYWIQPSEQQIIPLKRLMEQDKQQEVSRTLPVFLGGLFALRSYSSVFFLRL